MKINQIIQTLENWAPLTYAEDFDNVGLLVGDKNRDCTAALITHDVSVDVVEEAIEKKCNLIICFHPIVFKGLTSITGKNYVEKTVLKAIENKIAIYALHTALDNHKEGISYHLGKLINLKEQEILIPQKNSLFHLTTYVPLEAKEAVLSALHQAGAGSIGSYSHCSFNVTGQGSFKPGQDSNPAIGEKEKITKVEESQIAVVVPKHAKNKVLSALEKSHPYEAVAYELVALENQHPGVGLGSIGKLEKPLKRDNFLHHLKNTLNIPYLRHSEIRNKEITTVAVLGGSGSFCIDAAIAKGADALVTADLKYHDFFRAEKQLLLVDAGHYETEQFTKRIIHEYLTKKIPNFAFTLSQLNTNPVKYF
ncbi:MAG: Nif3-like dinuclear metal center hexameric protein [Flavobacteriaceae bacterium]